MCVEGGITFSKISKQDITFIREMRVENSDGNSFYCATNLKEDTRAHVLPCAKWAADLKCLLRASGQNLLQTSFFVEQYLILSCLLIEMSNDGCWKLFAI